MVKKIMVCVTQQKNCSKLMEEGYKLRETDEDIIHVVHVVNEKDKFLYNTDDGVALEYLFEASKNIGADLTVKRSNEVIKTLVEFAEENEINELVIGAGGNKENSGNKFEKMLKNAIDATIHVIK